jgi:glycyl-tRNA synthetase beta chain
MKEALLEIGSEELPASFIAPGMRQLKALAEESLKTSGLTYTAIETHGTPRRLAIVIQGLSDHSPDQKKVVIGPPSAIAKDAQGQWTPAAMGFARKQGLKPSDLTMDKDRLSAILHIKGVATRQLLADLFPQWISRLEFPKSMVWEPTKFRYPRPIRWIAALYGSDLVSFSLAGVRSARWTLGIGPWAPKKIPIAQAGKYAILLKNQCVLVDTASRQDTIRRFADQAVKRVHGKVHMSAALLEQVANLVEHPVAILGNFDPAYLDLPKEVLITCLEHHQKYFPVLGPHPNPLPKGEGADRPGEAKLLPHFVGIRNGMSVHQEIVREGYERVLSARLADARFFFNQDRRTPLSSKVDALKGVMFQQKLGSLYDKQERLKKLLVEILPGNNKLTDAVHAAGLCKADLVTEMVREFPELQGIMARIYALADGESEELSSALEQHYWPITRTSPLPISDVAAAIALADKLDTLAGDFAVGLIPTGSADPYGLRRAAVGVIRILEDRKWPLSLGKILMQALESQPAAVCTNAADTWEKLNTFMKQRLSALLEERGYKFDEIDAVLEAGLTEIDDILNRLKALHDLRASKEFEPLSVAFKRGKNIVLQAIKAGRKVVDYHVQSELFKEVAEKQLFETLEKVQEEVDRHVKTKSYYDALVAMTPLRQPLDDFFTGVMVMDKDIALQTNRLALMLSLARVFSNVADFSKLQNA